LDAYTVHCHALTGKGHGLKKTAKADTDMDVTADPAPAEGAVGAGASWPAISMLDLAESNTAGGTATSANDALAESSAIDLDKLIMNYLVVEGHKDAAAAFADESGEIPLADLAVVEQRMKIRAVVQDGEIPGAIEMANNLNPDILDTNHQLYFRLYLQRLIELIKGGKVEEALVFAEEELVPLGEDHPELMEDLEEVMALFAFPDKEASPLAHLLNMAQRQKTASELNRAILAGELQDTTPRLHSLLKLLHWSQDLLGAQPGGTSLPRLNLGGQTA